jgi:hypothetical protein
LSKQAEPTLFDASCLQPGDQVWASYHPSWMLLALARVIDVAPGEVLLEFAHSGERLWRDLCTVRMKIGDGC